MAEENINSNPPEKKERAAPLSMTQKIAIIARWDELSEGGKKKKGVTRRIADEMGVSEVTVYKVLKNGSNDVPKEAVKKTKAMRAEMLEKIIDSIIENWHGDKRSLKGLNPAQIPMAVGILIDKVAALKDEPNIRIEHVEKARELEEKLKRIEAVRDTLLGTLSHNHDPAK